MDVTGEFMALGHYSVLFHNLQGKCYLFAEALFSMREIVTQGFAVSSFSSLLNDECLSTIERGHCRLGLAGRTARGSNNRVAAWNCLRRLRPRRRATEILCRCFRSEASFYAF